MSWPWLPASGLCLLLKSNKGSTYLFILYYLFIDPRALSSLDETASDTSDSQILDKEDNSQSESEENSFL